MRFLRRVLAVKSALLIFLLLMPTQRRTAAEPGDVVLARALIREARELCGTDCDELVQFAALEAKVGNVEASKKSFLGAWNAAAKLEDDVERGMALDGVAKLQARAGQFKEAIEASQHLPSRFEQAMTLRTIAVVRADSGDEKAALETVALIPAEEAWARDSTLSLVAMSLAERRDFAGAIRVVNRISSDDELAEKILARTQQPGPQEQEVIDAALMKSSALAVIVEDQAKAGQRKLAYETALGIGMPRHRDAGLLCIARIAADSGDLAIAEAALESIDDQAFRDFALARAVAAMAKLGRAGKARELLETIHDPDAKVDALFGVAAAQAARGDAKAARSLVEDATALKPSSKDAQDAGFKRIVAASIKSQQLKVAEAFARDIHDPAVLSETLQMIAVANWQAKRLSAALRLFGESRKAAEHVAAPYQRCVRLRDLALAQFKAGEKEGAMTTIGLALASALKIEIGGGTNVIALTEIATTQGRIGDRQEAAPSFRIAAEAAVRYPDASYVAQLLEDVAAAQADAGGVAEAIEAARQQESALNRACMLLGVANAILSQGDETR